jgi:hypothetical protein
MTLRIAAAMMVAAAGAPAWAQQQPSGSWPAAGQYSTGWGFTQGGSGSDGTYLYVFGGGEDPWSARRYDPVANTWEDLPSMPAPNQNFEVAHYNGSMYTFGNGWQGAGWISQYDIASRTWNHAIATLNGNRYIGSVAALGNRMFIAGGINPSQGWTAECDEFDPQTRQVIPRTAAPAPFGLAAAAGFPANGNAYFIGGFNDQGFRSECYEFDPAGASGQGAWTERAPQPLSLRWSNAWIFNNRIYVVGGQDEQGQPLPWTYEYAPFGNVWTQRASMNTGRFAHASGRIGDRGYVYGGITQVSSNIREEYIPPDFGKPPTRPVLVRQVGPTPESSAQGGWTNNQIRFETDLKDPDAGQQVRLEVQVRASGAASWGPVVSSGLRPQGLVTLDVPIAAGGGHDWRWRVADAFDNYAPSTNGTPEWVEAFENGVSPDFQSDQVPPAQPIAVSPHETDVTVREEWGGPVRLEWLESTDNGPQSAIRYEIQVSRNASFSNLEAQLTSSAGNSALDTVLSVNRNSKYWRLRARDIGGNLSAWSDVRTFRVVFDDGVDHAGGDGKKACGFGAGTRQGLPLIALFAVLALAATGRRITK